MLPDYTAIPENTRETLEAWITRARPVGGFCEAVLCNDLREAMARADDWNLRALFHIVAWLWNCAPASCWGSVENYKSWPETLAKLRGENVE